MDAVQALDKLAVWNEGEIERWRKLSDDTDEQAAKEYWRGFANALSSLNDQIRGLLYEAKNPFPTGPWDSAGHMDSENEEWQYSHPLFKCDEDGNCVMDGVFYR